MTRLTAEVVVDAKTRQVSGSYTYLVPERLKNTIRPGHRVYVSFGRQHLQGFVVSVESVEEDIDRTEGTDIGPRADTYDRTTILRASDENPSPFKPVLAVLDSEPLLRPELLSLLQDMAHRYACTLLEAIQTAIPGAYRVQAKQVYKGNPDVKPERLEEVPLWETLCRRPLSFSEILRRFQENANIWLESLIACGSVHEAADLRDRVAAKKQASLHLTSDVNQARGFIEEKQKQAPKQARLLEQLLHQSPQSVHSLGVVPSDGAVRALLRAGLVRVSEEEVYRRPLDTGLNETVDSQRELTRLQTAAVKAIEEAVSSSVYHEFVLHGVTGSGKTEVYIRTIASAVNQGGAAAVLVPEIVLTPQMVGRFTGHFGSLVAVLHSGLSQGERRDEWLRIRRGQARVVIGARSAVFAPVENLKLIIVDEEHEASYKQEETPYYDAREIASMRAKREQAVVVFGSATPSLETMYKAEQGQARILTLPSRINDQPLPPVEVVDMREELRSGNRSIFSNSLQEGVEQAVRHGQQAVLFLNRRGFASFVLCRECGEVMQCPRCDISLTLHGRPGQHYLECHYCQFHTPMSSVCPHCGESALRPFGIGTQQVEQHLNDLWPDFRVLRMDVDTTRKKGAHKRAVEQFYEGGADILLGTQMIAKGLDFPNVTFVGVIAADTLLAIPDYRASERTFSLLTQVAGRAGRADLPGRIVVQTYRPSHYAITAAARHDYREFYELERQLRENFWYPPFCEMTVFKAVHNEENIAKGAARRFERELKRRLQDETVTVLPAAPERIARIEDKFRFQVVVKYSQWHRVAQGITAAYRVVDEKMRKLKGICVLDVNAGRI
ncbi:primosomal protein N' [Alicyclobacillus sp. SO9]|uniref:primosomal protein N' n=1 Tax=Alicyclobacillus sp. SO9 TaxID=2665646 RepID=UPI0018E86F0B|nr:primosomal protein N' [Alicyclobacillus sp. SO9]QQE80735.1 primosomal protein N' [Alicyclobacillus sp. SO9]